MAGAISSASLQLELLLIVLTALSLASVTTATPVRYDQHHARFNSKETETLSSKNASFVGPASCENVTCKLNFNPEDVDRFQTKIFDDEALAVFLYVTISNSSDVQEKSKSYANVEEEGKIVPYSLQLKEKWSWIRNKRAKFLATLPYDVDILSLTTLTKDAYNLILTLNSTPADCYSNLTQQCLKGKIAEGLIALTEKTGQVCFKVESHIDSKYHGYKCCHVDWNGMVHCDIPIKVNLWVQYALQLLWAISFAFGILSPLLLKYLPKEFQRRGKSKSRQMRRAESVASYDSLESSIVVASKILISKGDGFLDIARSMTQSTACSRFSRCLFVILLSLLPILQTLLYVFLKKSEVGVSEELLGLGSAFLTLLDPSGKYALLGLYCFCIILVAIAMAIPKTLSELARRLSGKRDEQSFLGFQKPDELICHSDKRGFQLMYENMIFHLNCLMMWSFWKFALSVLIYPLHLLCRCAMVDNGVLDEEQEEYDNEAPLSPCGRIIRGILLLLFFPLWIVVIVSAFILYILPVTYVAFRIWKMLFKFEVECACCDGIPTSIKMLSLPILYILFIVFCACVEASYFMLGLVISVNIVFLGSVIGFTTMGVLFYVDAYISYVVVIILGLYYIIRAFHDLKVAFKRVKVMIFDQCEEHDHDLKTEASIRDAFAAGQTAMERSGSANSLQKLSKSMALVTLCDEKKVPSIPLKLFLMAQNEVFPFKRVIISKILNLLMIFIYLLLVFSFVMSLVEYKAADSLVQAIAILLLGAVPYFMQGNPHEIPEKEEKWIKFHVREQINKYCKRFA